ncbi:37S ribosomal protein S25 [Stachybotrys elegans]|uniref:37S ribosomal protein S25, mitochondrial n=1 Tax=Stachybotrys elegans TaxID=80388 RepID=A0A8K0WRV8_9HYPO|nr:37S ribosomal protein S25 [Stachybotrys elegans]
MGRQIRPAQVFKNVTEQLNNRILPGHETSRPPWYNIMRTVPPTENSVRPIPLQHRQPSHKAKAISKKMYQPQRLVYPEDALRTKFFKDHPWELARPRVILETDGRDHENVDWGRGLRQPGLPLSGECVVQRQLWLMENEKMPKQEAYDKVRKEFYRLRQEEEIEKRVALEEARYVGAYFGKTRMDVGMLLEDLEFENWKIWAGKMAAEQNSQTETIDSFDEGAAADDVTTLERGDEVPAAATV